MEMVTTFKLCSVLCFYANNLVVHIDIPNRRKRNKITSEKQYSSRNEHQQPRNPLAKLLGIMKQNSYGIAYQIIE